VSATTQIIFGSDRLHMMPRRFVLLLELDINSMDDDGACIDDFKVVEMRSYDMTDHEQCALQFTRERAMQGSPLSCDYHRLVVIGGDSKVEPLDNLPQGTSCVPVERVPYTIWRPVPPTQPMWDVLRA
jgi:hypothetical protein